MRRLLPCAVLAALALPGTGAWAERTLVIATARDSALLPRAAAAAHDLRAALSKRGVGSMSEADASAKLDSAHPVPRAALGSLEPLLTDARRLFYYQSKYGEARKVLGRVRRESSHCAEIREATLLEAVIALTQENIEDTRRLLEEITRADPGLHLSEADHPPPLRALWHEVKAKLDAGPRTALTVLASPVGARVHVGPCIAGPAPLRRERLYAGSFEVWAEGGRVHRITLGAQPVTVEIDVGFEQSLRTRPTLGLAGIDRARLPSATARLGALLGTGQVIAVEAEGSRVRTTVVRSADGTVLRQAAADAAKIDELAAFCASGERGSSIALTSEPAVTPLARPWYRRWWVWTLIGIGAAGAAGGTVAGLRGGGASAVIVSGGRR